MSSHSPMKTTTSFQTWNAICQILAISHIQCCHIKQLIKDITMNIVTFSSLIYKAKYILYKHATPYISKFNSIIITNTCCHHIHTPPPLFYLQRFSRAKSSHGSSFDHRSIFFSILEIILFLGLRFNSST